MGSVKDLVVIQKPTIDRMGGGGFYFSNRYSLFDWGKMPDHIPKKGRALCYTSAKFFFDLDRAGVPTHYISGGWDSRGVPTNEMYIYLTRVIYPKKIVTDGKVGYDYSVFQNPELKNFLIPLEIIYRNGLPEGSSVFKRLKRGELALQDLGLDHEPQPGEVFKQPYFDVSTKLEDGDRYLGWAGAKEISGLADHELTELRESVMSVNNTISNAAKRAGLINWDGKFEFGFDPDRRLLLLDTIGTLDECRFTYNNTHVSKELLRQYYRRTQPDWVAQIDEAKKSGAEDWKSLVEEQPEPLPASLRDIVSSIYMSAANALTDTNAFSEAPPLSEVVAEYKRYMESLK